MKIRFPVSNQHEIGFKGCIPYLGLDTSEVVSFHLNTHGDLLLWFRGIPDAVVITENELGEAYFKDLLTLLCADFRHIDDAKPRIALLAEISKPLDAHL